MTNQTLPKPDTPWTQEDQALDLKRRMQAAQDGVARLLDEIAAAGLQAHMTIMAGGDPVVHSISVEIIRRY
jgi:hypothetical protein